MKYTKTIAAACLAWYLGSGIGYANTSDSTKQNQPASKKCECSELYEKLDCYKFAKDKDLCKIVMDVPVMNASGTITLGQPQNSCLEQCVREGMKKEVDLQEINKMPAGRMFLNLLIISLIFAVPATLLMLGAGVGAICLIERKSRLESLKENYIAGFIPKKPNFFNIGKIEKECYENVETEHGIVTKAKEFPLSEKDKKKYARIRKGYIPDQIRNQKFDEMGNLDKKVAEMMPQLYGKVVRIINAKKGEWQIYERKEANEFCAVYVTKGKARTLFTGDLKYKEHIETTVEILSKNVLEQKTISWPPKSLTLENGYWYGFGKGVILPAALLVDTVAGLSTNLEYKPIAAQFVEYAFSYKDASTSMAILMGGFFGMFYPLHLSGKLFKKLGRAADIKRIQYLPDEANSFNYGQSALIYVSESFKNNH